MTKTTPELLEAQLRELQAAAAKAGIEPETVADILESHAEDIREMNEDDAEADFQSRVAATGSYPSRGD